MNLKLNIPRTAVEFEFIKQQCTSMRVFLLGYVILIPRPSITPRRALDLSRRRVDGRNARRVNIRCRGPCRRTRGASGLCDDADNSRGASTRLSLPSSRANAPRDLVDFRAGLVNAARNFRS